MRVGASGRIRLQRELGARRCATVRSSGVLIARWGALRPFRMRRPAGAAHDPSTQARVTWASLDVGQNTPRGDHRPGAEAGGSLTLVGEACILGIVGGGDYFSSEPCPRCSHRQNCEPDLAVAQTAATVSPPRRWINLLAWGIAGFAYLIIGFAIALAIMNGPALRDIDLVGAFVQAAVPSIAIALVGGLIASRQPRNPIGWLLLFGAIATALQGLAGQYAVHTVMVDRGSLPGVEWMAWLGSTVGGLVYPGTVVLILLLFPNGRLPSTRWRSVMWLDLALAAVNNGLGFLDPAPIASPGVPRVPNPLVLAHINGLEMGPIGYVVFLGGLLVVLAAAVSLVIRLRRARGAEREKVRWVDYALGTTVLISIADTLAGLALPTLQTNVVGNVIVVAGFGLGLPAAIGVAMLRYHLYDIDIVISRTLVYGTLAVLITAVYVGIAVGIGTLVGSGGKPNLGLSILATAIVAVGFQPVRERLQKIANRLVYGKRATPYQVLSQFSERVAESYASDDVLPRMARVLAEGTNADLAEVWLLGGGAPPGRGARRSHHHQAARRIDHTHRDQADGRPRSPGGAAAQESRLDR